MTTDAEPTAAGTAATSLVRALGTYGVDGREVARLAGVADAVFTDSGARLTSDTLDRFMAMAADASGDPAFALRFARQHRAISRELSFAMAASDTLGDAWRRLSRYQAMVSERLGFEVTPEGDTLRMSFSVPEPEVGRWHPSDVMAASMVFGARGLSMDGTLAPIRIELRRPRPVAIEPYDELFQCPLCFDSERNLLVWDSALVGRELPLSNPQIAAQSEGVVVAYLGRLDELRLASRLRRLLVRVLPDGAPRRDDLARQLGLSVRSLARGLASEQTSYSRVLDDVRESVSRDYLRCGTDITEIAFLVGFSETSAFCRAFRRWTGETPTAFATRSATSQTPTSH